MKQTLTSMLPNLVNEYNEIMNEFVNGDYGVLDDNPSMHYAMFGPICVMVARPQV